MARIGFVHFPAQGHVGPALRLARVLLARDHRVVHFAPEALRGQIEASGGELHPVGIMLPSGGQPIGMDELSAGLAELALALTPATVECLHAEQVDIVVNDAQATWGRVAGDWLGLPRVCSWPLFPPGVAAADGVGHGQPWSPERSQPYTSEVTQRLLRCREAVGRRWGIDLGRGFTSAGDVNLLYTIPEIAGDGLALDASWRFVGPMMDADPHGDDDACGEDDDTRPLVYVALGTYFSNRPALFRAALDALADEPVRVLASTWGQVTADDLAPVPPNAVVADRVDSRAVLRCAAVHISHGGASSVHESLLAGVPMLFVPQGADQHHWAARLTRLGAGEEATEESPAALRAGVRRLIDRAETRANAAALGRRLEEHDGASIAVTAVEGLLA